MQNNGGSAIATIRTRWAGALRAGLIALGCTWPLTGWAAATATAPPAQIDVSRFEVTGNTLLPDADLQSALRPFQGSRSLAELRAAAAAVQDLYRQAGYGAVIAYLPEQSTAGGVVRIAVLEGKISRVIVTGTARVSPEAVRRALPLVQEGRTPNVRDIDRQIQFANENPSRQLAVTLEAGAEPGSVDVRIHVTEGRVTRWSILVDNTGDDRTGRWRAALAWRHDDVAGLEHQASWQVQTSPTRPKDVVVVTANYGVPFYGPGVRLDGYVAYSDVDGGATTTPVGRLDFAGRGHVVGARVTSPLPRRGEIDSRLSISLDRRDYLNDCRIAGLPPGACGAAGESVTATPITLELVAQRTGSDALGGYLTVSRNLGLGGRHGSQADFDAVRPGAPRDYTVWRISGYASPSLGAGWGLHARVLAQLGDDALVSGEQLGLAGSKSVRGYAERELIGDTGAMGSVELVTPELWKASDAAGGQGSLRLSLFGDAGRVKNHRATECRPGQTACSLMGYGLGMLWSGNGGQVKIDLARAGRDGQVTDKGDWALHLAASWTLD